MTIPDASLGQQVLRRPGLPLRDYQHQAIEAVRIGLQERGVRRPLIVLPTGSGKTVVFSHLLRRRRQSGRGLVLAHRGELLSQARKELQQIAPELRVGLVKAEADEFEGADVVVGSVQTLLNPARLARIGDFSTVVIDEAHHAVAPTYRKILDGLGCFGEQGPLTVGVTATAGERGDGVGLDEVFQELVFARGILYMILRGYLVDVEAVEIQTRLDYDQVAVRGGDYTDASLGEALDSSGVIDAAALAYAEHAADRRGVAFTPTIATADHLATRLRGLGIAAEHVSGETPPDERAAILGRVASGECQVICNAAVLTEGYNQPELSCALIARPTKSRPAFTQMAGRILRPHPGKPEKALLLCMQAPPEEGLATIADLAGSDDELDVRRGESLGEAAVRAGREAQAFGGRRAGVRLDTRQLDLFARSRLRWLPAESGFVLPVKGGVILLAPEPAGTWRVVEARNRQCVDLAAGLDLGFAQGLGEEQARAAGAIAMADAGWRAKPPSDNQLAALRRRRLPAADNSGAASDALSLDDGIKALRQLAGAA
jgi:superfamily II DNA or RNA helicase